MTREEIDREIAALLSLAENPPRPLGDSYLIVALARVIVDQEHRLRVLEPCRDGEVEQVHLWCATTDDGPLVCVHCRITKEPSR